jgi:hypothetical protein
MNVFSDLLSPADTHNWLLVTGALALIISLAQAWIVSLIYYVRVGFLKKIFPSPHQLIRSHVDYCIMIGLLGFLYVCTIYLEISLPKIILFLACLGALWNPFPFVFLAMEKDVEQKRRNMSVRERAFICIGFLPLTIGFGYTAIVVLLGLWTA